MPCDDKCGCPVPCPGGTACRCSTTARGEAGHSLCSCGSHCSCNPCSCGATPTTVVGKAGCTCGSGCACSTCA